MKGFDEWLDNHGNPAGYETFHDIGRDLRAERKAGITKKLPRDKCSYCHKTFALTKKGKVRLHKRDTTTCPGSRKLPLPKE